MINVLFFAQLREVLGADSLEVQADCKTIAELRHHLSDKGEKWHQFLSPDKSLAAVNQTLVSDDALIKENDEIAFFPPVTGG